MSDNNKHTSSTVSKYTAPVVEKEKTKVESPTINKETPVKKEEVKVETVTPVAEEPKKELSEVEQKIVQRELEKKEDAARVELKVGMKVRLKESCKITVNKQEVPKFAYRNIYRIRTIIPSRVVIVANTYVLAVKASDLIVV